MNKFSADYSSSNNSTPVRPPHRSHVLSSNVRSLASTTPIAPPPSQIFGSSTFGSGVSKLQLSKPSKSSPPPGPFKYNPALPLTKNGAPAKTASRPYHTSLGTSVASEYTSRSQDDYADQDMEEDDDQDDKNLRLPQGVRSLNRQSAASLLKFSQRDSRISTSHKSLRSSRLSTLPNKGNDSVVPNLARELAARAQSAPLTEPDEVILRTEQILRRLDEQTQYLRDNARILREITDHVYLLLPEWQRFVEIDQPSLDSSDIGPQPSATPFAKANYLASLLLALHHPPPSSDNNVLPTPQILLDWLDTYHVSYDPLYRTVASTHPNCTSHELFWDAIQSLMLRGKFDSVMHLFAEADFRYAASAVDDGMDEPGYKGAQLQSVQSVIYRARVLLNSCPVVQSGDWNVAGPEWDLFRTQVESELDNLTDLAASQNDDDSASFEAENFGLRKPGMSLLGKLGQSTASAIPWTIFQNLKILYSILLGSAEEIAAQSQDWLEAATSLTIWWDGSADAAVAQWSFDVSRANMAEDVSDLNPYLGRLRDSFLSVTDLNDNNSFQINAMSPVEVGLGAVLQGSPQSALIVLRVLSQCVASSIAEIGTKADWIEADGSARPSGLNEEDLMVLSYGAPKQGVSKDDILLGYAERVFEKPILRLPDGSAVEGWEVAISVVTRLDDREVMHTAVTRFLGQLEVVSQDRAEKLTNLCSDLGLQDEARNVSDRFGDYLVNNTAEYGTALLCYARSHASHKIRQLIDLLVSYSLVESRAYPPEEEMDDGLQSLVETPRTALSDIAEVDPEAAEMLQFYLVGYACLRRFYTLRDEESLPNGQGSSSDLHPFARRRAASKSLVAAINSAADSIYGGLYDPERQSAIQVDGLLTLLGEATALLASDSTPDKHVFTSQQIHALLAAIEDLSTVSPRVYEATEECLQAALRNYHGSQPPSPHALLKKSMSSGSNSNFSFSMMGSEMLARSDLTSPGAGGKSVGSSGILVPEPRGDIVRGWDWRVRFKDREVTGRHVVKVLRMALARELSMVELEAET